MTATGPYRIFRKVYTMRDHDGIVAPSRALPRLMPGGMRCKSRVISGMRHGCLNALQHSHNRNLPVAVGVFLMAYVEHHIEGGDAFFPRLESARLFIIGELTGRFDGRF